jgi:hypothetical protein
MRGVKKIWHPSEKGKASLEGWFLRYGIEDKTTSPGPSLVRRGSNK